MSLTRGRNNGTTAFDLTIVVPAFNEAHRLTDGLARFDAAVADGAVDLNRTELLIIDDGSTDETADTARRLLTPLPHQRVISLPRNRGKGAAVRTGISLARGTCTAYMDADMAIDPRAIPLLVEGLRTADVAIGSRALADSMVDSRYVLRSVMGGLFNRLVTIGTGLGLHDTQCGFKAFRTQVGRLLFHLVRIDRFAFDVEVLIRARRLGLNIVEVPVQWKHVPGSTVHPLHDSLRMLADVYRSRLGLRTAPPISTLTVRERASSPGPDTAALAGRIREAVAHVLPAVPVPIVDAAGTCLVLLPLVGPADVAATLEAVRSAFPSQIVTCQAMDIHSLARLAPLAGRLRAPGSGD
jgi:dolichyl-phosphate beta-glucosyltransferase